MYGHNVSHSKRRTRKLFKPNLHTARILINGSFMRMKLCTKCLRMFNEATASAAVANVEKSTMVEVTEPTTTPAAVV